MQSLMELMNMPEEENVVKEIVKETKDVLRLSLVLYNKLTLGCKRHSCYPKDYIRYKRRKQSEYQQHNLK